MAGEPLRPIAVVDLLEVCGGLDGALDRQTSQAQQAITAATSAVEDIARATAPKDNPIVPMMMQMMGNRRPGPGPTPAPALPPTSTLTR